MKEWLKRTLLTVTWNVRNQNEIQLHPRQQQGSSLKKTTIHYCLILTNISKHF